MRLGERPIRELDAIGDRLFHVILRLSNGEISEGLVMTPGPPPYRRLDCGPRALAYVRSRPRKGIVRVDVSGLWVTPEHCRLRVPGRGMATLFLRSRDDVPLAARFLIDAVHRTRTQPGGAPHVPAAATAEP